MAALDGISTLQTTLSSLNVSDAQAAAAAQSRTRAATGAETSAAQAGSLDRTSLSAAAGLAADDSDVRLGKVAELRTAINNGTYNVSASAVADKIVEGLLGSR